MRVSETRRGRGRCGRLLVLWTTLVRVVPRAAGVLRRLDDPADSIRTHPTHPTDGKLEGKFGFVTLFDGEILPRV